MLGLGEDDMLRAISSTALCIDDSEYPLDAVPDGLLTEDELAQVRAVIPGALPEYVVCTEPTEVLE